MDKYGYIGCKVVFSSFPKPGKNNHIDDGPIVTHDWQVEFHLLRILLRKYQSWETKRFMKKRVFCIIDLCLSVLFTS